MAKLLHVESSPRKERSSSIRVAAVFLAAYRKAHPGDTVETLDLWKTDLPRFDGQVIDSKYAILHGKEHTPEQKKAWEAVERVIRRFTEADKYLFSLPMWNFGIPYVLKHFFDVIVQPTYTFSFSPKEGYKGLVSGKPAAVVYARGGAYPPGSPGESFDLQKRYIELILGFIGFQGVQSIVAEPTMGKPEQVEGALQAAVRRAETLAATF